MDCCVFWLEKRGVIYFLDEAIARTTFI